MSKEAILLSWDSLTQWFVAQGRPQWISEIGLQSQSSPVGRVHISLRKIQRGYASGWIHGKYTKTSKNRAMQSEPHEYWLPPRDSNPDMLIQSQLSCR
jgi:hypothetical protein